MTRESRSDSGETSGARRHAPRKSERGAERPVSRERSDSRGHKRIRTDGGDDIPLNIAGHDERERPRDSSPGPDAESDVDSSETRRDTEDSVLEFSEADEFDVTGEDDGDADGDDEDVEPVELLVQLAKGGEIDPWDIDIVAVTDKFLEALDDADLRTSGRALFYASVLLRMKSDELFAPDEPEADELPPWEEIGRAHV